jgi:hypothetical protein
MTVLKEMKNAEEEDKIVIQAKQEQNKRMRLQVKNDAQRVNVVGLIIIVSLFIHLFIASLVTDTQEHCCESQLN